MKSLALLTEEQRRLSLDEIRSYQALGADLKAMHDIDAGQYMVSVPEIEEGALVSDDIFTRLIKATDFRRKDVARARAEDAARALRSAEFWKVHEVEFDGSGYAYYECGQDIETGQPIRHSMEMGCEPGPGTADCDCVKEYRRRRT